MKRCATLLLIVLFSFGCSGQENKKERKKELSEEITAQPRGSWKVNKEFDEAGNLIRYDSIYSWSSTDDMEDFMTMDRDSIFKSFRSRFSKSFSGMEDMMDNVPFTQDSLFIKRFFVDDFFESEFGQDFMDLDRMQQRMETMQKRFLEQYHLQYPKEEETQKI